MALDHLLDALERNAREESVRILEEARAECARLSQGVEADAAARRASALAVRQQELNAAAVRALAAVRREARQAVLEARQLLLARVRAAVERHAAAAEGDPGSLATRLQAALACFGDVAVEIHCPRRLVTAVRRAVDPRPRTRVAVAPRGAGVLVVRAADGSVDVDASLTGLVARRWPSVAVEVVRILTAPT